MTSSTRCHIIDSDGSFVSSESFGSVVRTSPSKDASSSGGKYWVVAIFGGQSTGKSTLLNGLFGTHFDTMNEDTGRSQTTRGIWLEPSAHQATLYAMDVEGTDGQERFDNQTFERRTSLFALAVCDVFIINMWTAEVGRFNAANLSLLRTIFEIRLELFPSLGSRRTKILFVLRDHVSGTLEKHSEVMRSSLEKVWCNVAQTHSSSRALDDVFLLHFVSLPHYHLQKEDFDLKLAGIKDLLNPSNPTSILSDCDEREGVPLAGLHGFMKSVWETVYANKDLDIPSQKELLARHRCAEISTVLIEDAMKRIEEWRSAVCDQRKVVPGLGTTVQALANTAEAALREEAKLYAQSIVERSGCELKENILKAAEPVIEACIHLILHNQRETFTHRSHSIVDAALMKSTDAPTCWTGIRQQVEVAQKEVEILLEERVKEGILDSYTYAPALSALQAVVHESISNRLRIIAQDLHKRMHEAFEYALHHNKDGSTRFFHSATLLSATAKRCQLVGFDFLDAVCIDRLKSPELDTVRLTRNGSTIAYNDPTRVASLMSTPYQSCILVELPECQRAYDLYLQQAEFTVQMMERNIEMGVSRIPWYFWVLLVGFARNDIWYIVTSPMILITLVTVLYFFLAAYVKDWIVQTLTDPPVWFQYIEFALEQHVPSLSTWIRDRRAMVAAANGTSHNSTTSEARASLSTPHLINAPSA